MYAVTYQVGQWWAKIKWIVNKGSNWYLSDSGMAESKEY